MNVGLNTQNLMGIVVVVVLSLVNIFGVKTGAMIQNIFTISKVSALFGFVAVALFVGRNAYAIRANFQGNFWFNSGLGNLHDIGGGVLVGTLTVLAVAQVWRKGGPGVVAAAVLSALQMLTGAVELILLTWLLVILMCLVECRRYPGSLVISARNVGMVIALVSLVGFVGLALRRLIIGPEAEGLFTLFAIAFFLIGVLLMGVGVVGEYVGRIYEQVRQRPRYTVAAVLEQGDPAVIQGTSVLQTKERA